MNSNYKSKVGACKTRRWACPRFISVVCDCSPFQWHINERVLFLYDFTGDVPQPSVRLQRQSAAAPPDVSFVERGRLRRPPWRPGLLPERCRRAREPAIVQRATATASTTGAPPAVPGRRGAPGCHHGRNGWRTSAPVCLGHWVRASGEARRHAAVQSLRYCTKSTT